jgi:putative membrane protein
VRIEVGYGLEGTLTDAVSRLIIENSIVPRLRANDFAGGIGRGVDDIIQAVSVDPEEWGARAQQRPDGEPRLVDLLAPLLFLFIMLLIFSSIARKDRRYAQSGTTPRRGGRGPIFIPIPGSWGPFESSWPGSSGGFSGGGGSFGGGGASGSFLLGRTNGIENTTSSGNVGEAIISELDKRRIAEAIHAAEEKTSGQILCVVARACGDYGLVPIAWAAIIALAVPLVLIYVTSWPAGMINFIQLVAFVVTALVLSLPMIRFHIVPKSRMWRRAHAEAMHQFLAQGVHLTKQRTGVLIFASLAEDYAEIIPDSGISSRVSSGTWADAIATLVTAIKARRLGDGFVTAIELCGAGLARNVPPGELKSNELPDRIVEV